MNTELENIKHNLKSADSLASRVKGGPPGVSSQPESEPAITAAEIKCKSRLSDPPQNQDARGAIGVGKESLADWFVVACVCLSNVIASIDYTGFGVFYPYLVQHFDATTAAVGWCSSISGFSQAVTALLASYPIKFYGCRLPGAVGCLLFAIGMVLSYFAPNLTTIYFTYGIIAGSGKGIAMLVGYIILHQRFRRNRNLASGIGMLGISFGGIFASFVTNQLIEAYSWRGAFLVLGAIQAHRIPLCLFFRTPKTLTSQSNHVPETSSRRISGQMILRYLKETFNFSILCYARYSTYAIVFFIHMFCLIGYSQHTVNRAIQVGLGSDQAVASTSLYSILSVVARLIVSFIANLPKVKSSLVFACGMFCVFLSIVMVFIDPGIIGTMTSGVLFGIYLGSTTTVFANVAVDLMGVALLPRSLAVLQFLGGCAGLVSPPLIGWVFDVTRDYNKAFAIMGCLAFVAGWLMLVLTFVSRCHKKPVNEGTDKSLVPAKATNT